MDERNVPYIVHEGAMARMERTIKRLWISGKVAISATEQAKIIPGNIKSGVVLLGVTGDYSGQTVNVQTKTVTPTASQQTVLPDTGYDYLSQVTVNAIPYVESANQYGTTVTIG